MENIPLDTKSVANFFIDLARRNQKIITPMKLQKLVYYAHGWCLALFEKPLINEAIEAWRYGPVIESLYHELKHYGNQNIDDLLTDVVVFTGRDGKEEFQLCTPRIPENSNLKELLEKVWSVYSPYSPIELSSMTHQPGSPWDQVFKEKGAIERNAEIGQELIKEYFKVRK